MREESGEIRWDPQTIRTRLDEPIRTRTDTMDVRTRARRRVVAVRNDLLRRRDAVRNGLSHIIRGYTAGPGTIMRQATAMAQNKPGVVARRKASKVLPIAGGMVAAGVGAVLLARRRGNNGGSTKRQAGRAAAGIGSAMLARRMRGTKQHHSNGHSGSGDVVDLLLDQHKQIKRAFRRAALPGPQRRPAFEKLVKLLSVHEAAEEAHVHPTTRRILDVGREVAASRREEEKQAKKLLVGLVRGGTDQSGFGSQLRQLRHAVLSHAAHEEREEFPALRRALHQPRLRALRAEVKLTQALAPTRPHRWVNNELANKLATPIAGPLDRARDVARDLRRNHS